MITVVADFKRFTAALRAVKRETRKTEADIVTRACRDVAYRAASFTPFATPGKIRANLRRGNMLAKLAAASLKGKQGRYTRAQHIAEMERIGRARQGRTKALRAGWIPAIQQLGGSYRGARLMPMSTAAEGFGKRATIGNLRGWIRNAIVTQQHNGGKTGAGDIKVAVYALSRAVAFVAADREKYLRKKRLEAIQKRHSDK